jgi:outer membrane protein assembly factor BamB
MPIHPHRPRGGRLLDVLVVALCLFVFVGLAVYHYRRLDRVHVDPDKAKELAGRKLDTPVRTDSHDWPHFRGPNYDGVSTETDILAAWPSDGPKALWEAKVGQGFASVAVSKGRAYTIFQDGEDEAVVAWDAETGTELWRFRYPCQYTNYYGNGPRATPSVAGDFVYTVGATGIMHCLKDGASIWSKNLMEDFGAALPKWGVAFSPLVLGERVYILPGGPAGNSMAALDKNTGGVIWKQHDDRAGYASPIPATFHQQPQILFLTGSRLVSVHPDTGEQLWEFPWAIENECNIASPLVVEDYVFLSAYYGKGCAVLKIDKTKEAWQPSLVYKNKRMRNHISTSVFLKGCIYGFDDKRLKCMDFRTGEVLWEQEGFDKGSVLAFDERLIIYGANGLLALAAANPKEYVEKASFQFSKQGKSCWSAPVLANGRLYVRDQERLVCFDVRNKK